MIYYKSGYKYQLDSDYIYYLSFDILIPIEKDFFFINQDEMIIKKGYAWDGPSGPSFDTKNFMRGSLVHDVLYQAIREKELPSSYRELADKELYLICRKDGMSRFRAWYVLKAVRLFGDNVLAKGPKLVHVAP